MLFKMYVLSSDVARDKLQVMHEIMNGSRKETQSHLASFSPHKKSNSLKGNKDGQVKLG